MPSKSPAQHKLMEAIAHGMKPNKGGPSKAVAKEFAKADDKAGITKTHNGVVSKRAKNNKDRFKGHY